MKAFGNLVILSCCSAEFFVLTLFRLSIGKGKDALALLPAFFKGASPAFTVQPSEGTLTVLDTFDVLTLVCNTLITEHNALSVLVTYLEFSDVVIFKLVVVEESSSSLQLVILEVALIDSAVGIYLNTDSFKLTFTVDRAFSNYTVCVNNMLPLKSIRVDWHVYLVIGPSDLLADVDREGLASDTGCLSSLHMSHELGCTCQDFLLCVRFRARIWVDTEDGPVLELRQSCVLIMLSDFSIVFGFSFSNFCSYIL